MGCTYQSPFVPDPCGRDQVYSGYCVFHAGLLHIDTVDRDYRPHLLEGLHELIRDRDGNWRGFVFPSAVSLSPNDIRDSQDKPQSKIDFPIDARRALFDRVEITKLTFDQKVDFEGALFRGDFRAEGCNFNGEANFRECRFEKAADFQAVQFHARAAFYEAEFWDAALFRANFKHQDANFNAASFRSSARFLGYSIVHIVGGGGPLPPTEDYRVFEDGVQMQITDFAKPAQVLFKHINMSRVRLLGTNLRGARFEEVEWAQVTPKRKGLYDEIVPREEKRQFLEGELQSLEEAYRNMRAALEDNRSYAAAADFYVGEMEANRELQKGGARYFSVAALYRLLSYYGTSIPRAVAWLIGLFAAHAILTAVIQDTSATRYSCSLAMLFQNPSAADWTCNPAALTARSLRIILYQGEAVSFDFPHPVVQSFIDAVFRLFAAIQIALVVFAFRGQIKRY